MTAQTAENGSAGMAIFHSRVVVSSPPVARVLPSGLKATAFTDPLCHARGPSIWRCVVTSHNWVAPYQFPVASFLPSGLKATALIDPA